MSIFLNEFEKSRKVHSIASPWHVPFSWEEEPGISKKSLSGQPCGHQSTVQGQTTGVNNKVLCRLPPPPPCALLQPKDSTQNSIARKKTADYCEDPFLAALMECTGRHSVSSDRSKGGKKVEACPPSRRSRVLLLAMPESLSCKQSGDVREDTMVRPQSYNGRNNHLRPFCGPTYNGRRVSAGTMNRTSASKVTQKRQQR